MQLKAKAAREKLTTGPGIELLSMRVTLRGVAIGAIIGATTLLATRQFAVAHAQDGTALASRVDALFASEIRPAAPGCVVGVFRSGETLLARAYGVANVEDARPLTPRTVFDLGSMSKPFTAIAVLMLEQAGRLTMDDEVRRWVPEIAGVGGAIRVRDTGPECAVHHQGRPGCHRRVRCDRRR